MRIEKLKANVQWLRSLELLDERDVVALEQNLANIAPFLWCTVLLCDRNFHSVVDNEVHEFVETLDMISGQRDTSCGSLARTLSLPSMRSPKFSYSHTETVARDCRSLKMKLIGGRRTAPG